MDIKAFHKTATDFKDLTNDIVEYYANGVSFAYVTGVDFLYVGSPFPFNSFYIKSKVANDVMAKMKVELWNGSDWSECVSVEDKTSASGKSLAQSGEVVITPDRNKSAWSSDDTVDANGTEKIVGLGSVTIYDYYWTRISFNATLKATTAIKFIGHLFLMNDNDLYTEYSIFSKSNFKTAFETGKTDWEEQRFKATELVIDRMISMNIIESPNQLLDTKRLRLATVSMTAKVIYQNMGDDYIDQMNESAKECDKRLKSGKFFIDYNMDANLTREKMVSSQRNFYR